MSPYFLLPILAGLVAQGLKSLLSRETYRQTSTNDQQLPHYGGMPSAHTAFAFSLATVVAYVNGITSVSFAIAVSILIFILDDALRMRIFIQRHGQALKQLISQLPPEVQREFPVIESRLGHQPLEVMVGALLGIFLTLIILVIW